MLDDTLVAMENAAVAALDAKGIAKKVKRRQMSLLAPDQNASVINIAVLEDSTVGNFLHQEEVTIVLLIQVAVTSNTAAQDLAEWLLSVAVDVLRTVPEVRAGFAHSSRTEKAVGKRSRDWDTGNGTRSAIVTQTYTAIQRVAHRTGQVEGFDVEHNADQTATDVVGAAMGSTAAKLIAWIDRGTVIGPGAFGYMYANAASGDTVRVVDALGAEVYTGPVQTVPTGTGTVNLVRGTFNIYLESTAARQPLTVTEPPA